MDDDDDLTSVATTPPMKPVVTDRSDFELQSFPGAQTLICIFFFFLI